MQSDAEVKEKEFTFRSKPVTLTIKGTKIEGHILGDSDWKPNKLHTLYVDWVSGEALLLFDGIDHIGISEGNVQVVLDKPIEEIDRLFFTLEHHIERT